MQATSGCNLGALHNVCEHLVVDHVWVVLIAKLLHQQVGVLGGHIEAQVDAQPLLELVDGHMVDQVAGVLVLGGIVEEWLHLHRCMLL